MTYKVIALEAEPAGYADQRLECAVELARRFDAELVGVGAAVAPLAPSPDPLNDTRAAYEAQVQADIDAARDHFEKAAAGLRTRWRGVHGMPGKAMYEASRGADLIVAGGAASADRLIYRSTAPGPLALSCGRPVFVCCADPKNPVAEKAVIAWKDSPEARRAISDALPFLKAAGEVLILRLLPEKDGGESAGAVEEVAHFLQQHGVKARGEVRPRGARAIAEDLIDHAVDMGAGLIVSGAYGRTRLDDWVFGGVTGRLLRQDKVNLLISR